MQQEKKMTPPYTNMSSKPARSQLLQPTRFMGYLPLRSGCLFLGYFNLIITLIQVLIAIVVLTFVGVATDAFNLLKYKEDLDAPLDSAIFVIAIVAIFNIAWLAINIICVVRFHKGEPGPIQVYNYFVVFRLVYLLATIIYEVLTTEVVALRIIDVFSTAYYLLIYSGYVAQLQQEKEARNEDAPATAVGPPSYLEKIPPLTQTMPEKYQNMA